MARCHAGKSPEREIPVVILVAMDLIAKYPGLMAAVRRPEAELRADLKRAMDIIGVDPNSEQAGRLSVVRNWIGQALRLRTPGLNGPLGWAGQPLVVRVPQLA
jgi:hypothetical protein